ncbi:aldo/keto reductase [Virgibacillus ihumii]|uniref:aldo/keto reductase n=1 Tax=Virgibacillus ihumii TaxID=2686091 RepID=UPI00157D73FC|nr:aldo/keto reductase [Virgibacillus ihumii]
MIKILTSISNIIIGTAQFGMDYGVTNRHGRTTKDEVVKILRYCRQHNIHTIDTAASYGESEEIVGELITDSFFSIYSKTPYLNTGTITNRELNLVDKTFRQTLNKFKVNHIKGIFVHNANDLLVKNSNRLFQLLMDWKNTGLIKKIGVSVYDENQINKLMGNYDIDVFQIPINIYDQRLIHSNILNKMKRRNIEIHARSIFLQGVLLSSSEALPGNLKSLEPVHQKLESFLYHHGLTKLEGALKFISQIKQLDSMVVGINNLNHITEFIEAFNNLCEKTINFHDFQVNNLNIIDPRKW